MKYRLILFASAVFIFSTAFKSDKPAYQFYKSNGKKTKYGKVLKVARNADIILFGEMHNNPICHWLQLELIRDVFTENDSNNIILGAEMFEADDQLILDEYLSGVIKERNFEKEAKIWPNYKTDYKPIIDFAKANKIDFIATNIPRRYASVVHTGGFEALDSLSQKAKSYIAPLPVLYDPELEGYKSMLDMMGGMGHASDKLPKAQAIKDATMSYFILENWESGKIFIHFNGTYHSKNFEGIVWYLKKANPDLNILTINSVEQAQIDSLQSEHENTADFILAIPVEMTKTY
ncbi:MAG: ChaN family lipoprotein [Bacteroidales bacterium]|nr:ChaN family lipoprotein [Bacteroidales bacterium]MCF8387975.1 ChaN family lipoprotein [Bacteroidales bacterium]MCF8397383.1 ChaN family lipoprotein [Bacteroidales bacterium]